MIKDNLKQGLDLIGQFIVEQLWAVLHELDHVASGDLINSLRYKVVESGLGFEIVIIGKDYAENVEKGVPAGVWVSPYALADWIEKKGIETGEKEIKSLAFAIRRTIYDKGTIQFREKKKGFIEVLLDENAKMIFQMVLDLFTKEITLSLSNEIRKHKQTFTS
jgi:ribosomal protein S25